MAQSKQPLGDGEPPTAVDQLTRQVQDAYKRVLPDGRISRKALQRPGFKLLHVCATALALWSSGSFAPSLFDGSELMSGGPRGRRARFSFLVKLAAYVEHLLGRATLLNPARVLAGLAPEVTLQFALDMASVARAAPERHEEAVRLALLIERQREEQAKRVTDAVVQLQAHARGFLVRQRMRADRSLAALPCSTVTDAGDGDAVASCPAADGAGPDITSSPANASLSPMRRRRATKRHRLPAAAARAIRQYQEHAAAMECTLAAPDGAQPATLPTSASTGRLPALSRRGGEGERTPLLPRMRARLQQVYGRHVDPAAGGSVILPRVGVTDAADGPQQPHAAVATGRGDGGGGGGAGGGSDGAARARADAARGSAAEQAVVEAARAALLRASLRRRGVQGFVLDAESSASRPPRLVEVRASSSAAALDAFSVASSAVDAPLRSRSAAAGLHSSPPAASAGEPARSVSAAGPLPTSSAAPDERAAACSAQRSATAHVVGARTRTKRRSPPAQQRSTHATSRTRAREGQELSLNLAAASRERAVPPLSSAFSLTRPPAATGEPGEGQLAPNPYDGLDFDRGSEGAASPASHADAASLASMGDPTSTASLAHELERRERAVVEQQRRLQARSQRAAEAMFNKTFLSKFDREFDKLLSEFDRQL